MCLILLSSHLLNGHPYLKAASNRSPNDSFSIVTVSASIKQLNPFKWPLSIFPRVGVQYGSTVASLTSLRVLYPVDHTGIAKSFAFVMYMM